MPRKPSKTFTDKESEIMQILWEEGEATVKQVQDRLPGTPHYNSVLTIIRVLEKKGHLDHREVGRTYFYRARNSQQKARRRVLSHVVSQLFGGSTRSLVLNLVETGDLKKEDLDEIRQKLARAETGKGNAK